MLQLRAGRRRLLGVGSTVVAIALGWASARGADAVKPPPGWDGWEIVLGQWVGDAGKGRPGESSASGFTFEPDVGAKVLVRRDWAEFPAANGRPAFRHEGLLVVSKPDGKTPKAVYFDNEGHVIDYEVVVDTAAHTVVFTAAARPRAPGFRLTYRALDRGLDVRFEIAPPDQPDKFAPYIQGTAHRVAR